MKKQEDPEDHKNKGNIYYSQGKYDEAKNEFTKAIIISKEIENFDKKKISIYYSNRALASLSLKHFDQVLLDSIKSLENNKDWIKAKYLKAMAYYKLGKTKKSLDLVEESLKNVNLESKRHEFEALKKDLEIKLKEEVDEKENEEKERIKYLSENEYEERRKEGLAKLEDLRHMEKMLSSLPEKERKKFSMIDLYEFHNEYLKEYPKEKDHYLELEKAYYGIKSYPMVESTLNKVDYKNESYLLKRYGEVSNELINYLKSKRKVGEVMDFRNKNFDYAISSFSDTQGYHCFKNHPNHMRNHDLGHTHIGFGCTDLSQLLFSQFRDNRGEEKDPSYFYGYDMNIPSIARCWILYKMLQLNMPTVSILQVWFSSGWSKRTLDDFHLACKELLKEGCELINDKDEKIQELIIYWSRCDCISIVKARSIWFKGYSDADIEPLANLKNELDRVQYSRYIFTGEIFDTIKNEVGNKTMFQLPESLQNYERIHENIFYYFTISGTFYLEKSLVYTIEKTFTEKLEKLKEKIYNKDIICYFFVKKISHTDKSFILSIQQKDAYNIDWSNLPDYFNNESFLKMARACSTPKTVHSCHFLNWPQKIFGSSIIDYDDKETVLKNIKIGKKTIKQQYEPILNKLFNGFFNAEIVSYPLNEVDMVLQYQFMKNFIKFFFDSSVNLSSPFSELFNTFNKTNSFFTISFTFNKDIKLS